MSEADTLGKSGISFDLKGFAGSLKLDFCGAIHDVITKYGLSSFLKFTYNLNSLKSWTSLFKEVLRNKRFLFIVLDDTRFDFFKQFYPRYLKGSLCKVRVPPPHTYGWLPLAFSIPEFNNVRIFYGSLGVKTHDIRLRDFIPADRNIEVYVVKPRRLKHLKTILPWEINEVIKRVGLSGRDIIWYVQPHFPWVCDVDLSLMLMHEILIHDFVPPDTVNKVMGKYGISKEKVVKAYCCNLGVALRGVSDLLDYIGSVGVEYDRIVVTSDHGEMLGEYGLYLHQEYDLPQLVTVPWLEVEEVK